MARAAGGRSSSARAGPHRGDALAQSLERLVHEGARLVHLPRGIGPAEHLVEPAAREAAEVVGEALDQVAPGDQEVHGELDAELTHGWSSLWRRVRALSASSSSFPAEQLVGRTRVTMQPVQRSLRPRLAGAAAGTRATCAVGLVLVAEGVAARGVEDDRLLGEPPVAVLRAAGA